MSTTLIIHTVHKGGQYVASINGEVKATHGYSAHKAAQKAAGRAFATVKEIKPGVYRAS